MYSSALGLVFLGFIEWFRFLSRSNVEWHASGRRLSTSRVYSVTTLPEPFGIMCSEREMALEWIGFKRLNPIFPAQLAAGTNVIAGGFHRGLNITFGRDRSPFPDREMPG